MSMTPNLMEPAQRSAPRGMRRRMVMMAALALTVGALGLPVSAAEAREKRDPLGQSSCMYAGESYSHGAIVRHDDGKLYECDDGAWTPVRRLVSPVRPHIKAPVAPSPDVLTR
jgi:hypothetical protein